MNLVSQIKEIEKKISSQILFDVNLSKHSWFNLGGSAKVIFKPKNLNELSIFLKNLKEFNKIKVLGLKTTFAGPPKLNQECFERFSSNLNSPEILFFNSFICEMKFILIHD